jgi:EAL domain-containing protein (putative c-di-GMP-specific phosphodiesterase class I)/GGDEF domain-containing protein
MQKNIPVRRIHLKTRYIIAELVILALILAVTCLVYLTGGTNYAFSHLMYLPIILSACYLGIKEAAAAALLAGLAVGPLMPQNVASGLMQPAVNWMVRLSVFVTIGITSALFFRRIKAYKKAETDRAYINIITGYPNIGKLNVDLDELLDRETPFSIIGFRVVNISGINQNISYDIGVCVIVKALEMLSRLSGKTVYSIDTNEFAVILPGMSIADAKSLGEAFLNKTLEPFLIDRIEIRLLINGCVVYCPLQTSDSYQLIKKMKMTLDRATGKIGIYVFDDEMEIRSKNQSELIPQLLNAIQNDELSLVYQPKVSLTGEGDRSVEALLRWNHPTRGQLGPGEFLKTAEEAGIIREITKIVIKKAIGQKEHWKLAGTPVNIAINISPKDLDNNSVISYIAEILEDSRLDLSLPEIELTERGIMENQEIIIPFFEHLRQRGIRIALDDYGTGYNSLVNMFRIPLDYIKIDKFLIDHVLDHTYNLIIEAIINVAHKMDRKVIAEGVEKKEQLHALRQLGCDYIQGYYLSKPLPPDGVMRFYGEFRDKHI